MNQPARFLSPLLALLVFAGCGNEGEQAQPTTAATDVPEEQRYGGTAVVGYLTDVQNVNPLTVQDYAAQQMQELLLFLPLIAYNEKLKPVPRLARSWEVNKDTTQVTFHLRDDLRWHDGVKTTAYDMKFSYDLARDPKTAFANGAFWTYYGEAEAVDSFTFRVRMQPHAEFLNPWTAFSPVPRHILQGVAPEKLRTHPFSTTRPVGNGPFKFVSRQPGQNRVFAANADFPQELGGRPYLDRIVYRVIPEPTTLLTELLTGGIDYYIQMQPQQAQEIEASGRARVATYLDRAFTLIAWNGRRPMFRDVRVRRALTMAINRQGIIDGPLYGHGRLANATVPPMFWQYDPQAGADLGYAPERAKQLLAEAGWLDRTGDGIIENAAGKPFRFTFKMTKGNRVDKDAAEIVQSDLRKVGIIVQPEVVEWNTLIDEMNDPQQRDFDATIAGWVTEFRIDDTDLFHCDKQDGPYQYVGYCDPETDRLLDILPKIVSRAAAKPVWSQYQHKIAHDQPYTFLYFQEMANGVSRRLQNVHPDVRGFWVGVERWWILPDKRREKTQ